MLEYSDPVPISPREREEYLEFAREVSRIAGAATLPYFRAGVVVENKLDDGSFDPVTEADRAVIETFTLANQEGELRKLNQAVLATYPDDAPVRKLVHGWYGNSGPDFSGNTLSGNFQSDTVPAAWDVAAEPDASVSPRDLYLDVVAQNCRACHTQLLTQTHRTFETYDDFVAISRAVNGQPPLVQARVYDEAVMPLAGLTMDRFWVEPQGPATAADQLTDVAVFLGVPAFHGMDHPAV